MAAWHRAQSMLNSRKASGTGRLISVAPRRSPGVMLVRVAAAMARGFAAGRGLAIGRSNGVLGRLLRGYSLGLAHPVRMTLDAMRRAAFSRFLLARRMAFAVRYLFALCRFVHGGRLLGRAEVRRSWRSASVGGR